MVPDKYKEVKAEIITIYHENKGRYGYRRITAALRNSGIHLNHFNQPQDSPAAYEGVGAGLPCQNQEISFLQGRSGQDCTESAEPELLRGKAKPEMGDRRNRVQFVWTEAVSLSCFGFAQRLSGQLYVSYTISDRPVLGMVTSMLEKAFETIPDGTGLILHSDQGWQYQHRQYQRMLRKKGIRQSMSRKGNCLDNAVMENFFGLLKSELLYLQQFDSLEHFKQELVDYLDYYNNRRIKIKLKGLPPALHRQQALSVA